jgi:DNA modification methylase
MSEREFVQFLTSFLALAKRYSSAGALLDVFMDWRHLPELFEAAGTVDLEFVNMAVWIKNNAGMGSLYRSQHEEVCIFRNGSASHRNNVQLGRFGRNRTNVWSYPGSLTFSRTSDEGNLLALHPTVKPVRLLADAILDCTRRNDVVLDPFLGSGSTIIAAERTGRRCYGIELDPLYVDTCIRRWQRYCGGQARLLSTGQSFDDVAAERGLKNG